MIKPPSHPRQRGFTLIELIIFIVVVSVALAGILLVMNTVVKSSADPMVRKQSIAIAESLLEEILLKEYDDPNGAVGCTNRGAAGNRADWDDVCDYHGYKTTAGIVYVFSGDGTIGSVVPGLGNYNISRAVVIDPNTTDLTGVTAKKVTVFVTDPQGSSISLTGYRTCDHPSPCN